MTSGVSVSICGDVERPARLALAELRSREPQQATAATIALARLER